MTTNLTQLREHCSEFFTDNLCTDDPALYLQNAQWACDPESMSNTQFTSMWRLLYYHGDKSIIKNFLLFLLGKESFTFDGKTYPVDNYMQGDFLEVFNKNESVNEYLACLPDYCEKIRDAIRSDYPEIDTQFKELVNKFLQGYKSQT